jgi:hypothetical protein
VRPSYIVKPAHKFAGLYPGGSGGTSTGTAPLTRQEEIDLFGGNDPETRQGTCPEPMNELINKFEEECWDDGDTMTEGEKASAHLWSFMNRASNAVLLGIAEDYDRELEVG